MPISPQEPLHTSRLTQALESSFRASVTRRPARSRLIIAGATGVLGAEVLRRLVGSGRFDHTEVLASAPMSTGLKAVGIALTDGRSIDHWPARPLAAHTGVVMFEPPRLYYGRERSLWTPEPGQLLALAGWLKRCGVQTLVVVVPHATGRLPEALKRGLADLDELGVAALGFERLLLVRSARNSQPVVARNGFEKTAAWMLSTLAYMIPAAEQPVRPAKLAEFIEAVLRVLPAGTHVASPELLAQADHSDRQPALAGNKRPVSAGMQALVQAWLEGAHNRSQ